jgi:uncharacterized protein (TIGR03083 family)
MQVAEHLEQLQRAGGQLERAARSAGVAAAVPSCPPWNVATLVRHVARVYHWATLSLRGLAPESDPFERPDDDTALAVYSANLNACLSALRSPAPSLRTPTMYPAESVPAFFARRMAHETAIHRVDAELAAGCGVMEFDPGFAADGVQELLVGMGRARFNTTNLQRSLTITLTPLDVNRAWTVSAGPSSYLAAEEARDHSDLTVFAPASDLYRWIWNRAGDDEVALRGDVTVADAWRAHFTVRARS